MSYGQNTQIVIENIKMIRKNTWMNANDNADQLLPVDTFVFSRLAKLQGG